jgi:hypothetical protein
LRYSFDIRQDKRWREIGIDAKTGRVLENISESASPKDYPGFTKALEGRFTFREVLGVSASPVNCQAYEKVYGKRDVS